MKAKDITSHGPYALIALILLLGIAIAGSQATASEKPADGDPEEISEIEAAAAIEAKQLQASSVCPLGAIICAPREVKSYHSGLCLNVLDMGMHNGANVVQATNCNLSSSQWWVTGFGYSTLAASHSGKCLNVLNSSMSNGGNVVQATDCAGLNSQWTIEFVRWEGNRKLFRLKARHSDMCLNVLNMGTHNGCNVVQADRACSLASSLWFIEGE